MDVVVDESGKTTAITWEKNLVPGKLATHPGVYCLRSNELDWDAERMWRTYSMLTDLESVFRSLKSELGLRPVFDRSVKLHRQDHGLHTGRHKQQSPGLPQLACKGSRSALRT